MPVPLPKKPLGSHCSAIRNNTLYTFSENAFQSLELKNGSEWKTLPQNVGTKGAACVLAFRGTPEEALYIVGGSSNNPNSTPEKGFMGLQRWVFATKKWETVLLPNPVTYNLTNHGAAFLESTRRLIVFAGSAYPAVDVPSANTFLIQADGAHEIVALPAQKPLLAPIVLPWDQDGALIVGGNGDNTVLNAYTTSAGWITLGAKLDRGMKRRGQAWASLMDGDDGSRVLVTFDLTESPTAVQVIKVKDPSNGSNTKRQNRGAKPPISTENQLLANNWPKYNSTGAPKARREGTSLAYDGNMVVISGGNEDQPLLMFNARKNTWVSAESVLANNTDQDPLLRAQATSSGSPTNMASATPTPIPTLTVSTPGKGSAPTRSGPNTIQSLFIVLGSIIGAAFLLGACFYFLRKRRLQKNLKKAGDESRLNASRMSFQDRGASFMKEAGESVINLPPVRPYETENNNSWLNVQRQASVKEYGGNTRSHNSRNGPMIQRVGGQGVIVHPGQEAKSGTNGVSDGEKSRGSGWSRYFSGNSATNLVSSPARVYSGAQSSVYTDASSVHQNPFLHNAGPGVAAGGMGVVSIQRGGSNGIILEDPMIRRQQQQQQQQQQHYRQERRGSDISMSSIGGDSYYSSGIPESITEKPLWSQLDRERDKDKYVRNHHIPSSSVRTESRDDRRDTDWSKYSSGPSTRLSHERVDHSLSWFNFKSS